MHHLVVRLNGEWHIEIPSGPESPRVFAVSALATREYRASRIEAAMPPELRPTDYRFRNALTGIEDAGNVADLPIGFDSELRPGMFYGDAIGRAYFCERVDHQLDEATLILLGSVQHGRKIFSRFVIGIGQFGVRYAQITDPAAIDGLTALHEEWQRAEAEGKTQQTGFIADPARGSILMPLR